MEMRSTRRFVLVLACGLAACRPPPDHPAPLTAADSAFLSRAATAGAEIAAAGRLAARRATSPEVRQFAQRMVAEQVVLDRDLAAIARRKGVALPASAAGEAEQAAAERLPPALAGTAFDARYMAQQVQATEGRLALFREQADSGADPELRGFAEKFLSVLGAHAHMAQAVLDSLAVAAPVTAPGDRLAGP